MGRGNLNDVDLMRIASRDVESFLALGAVTTGSNPGKDAVVSLALANAEGDVLFDRLVCPSEPDNWQGAKIVRGVHMDEAKQAPGIRDLEPEVRKLLSRASLLVGYDLDTILQLLQAAGMTPPSCETFDLKHEYAAAHGRWSEWNKDYTFATLYELADKYGYAADDVHDAAEDARAAAAAFRGFVGECRDVVREQGGDPLKGARKRTSVVKRLVIVAIMLILAVAIIAMAASGLHMALA